MENIKLNDKEVRVLRLLKLIANTEETIATSKQWNDKSMVKGFTQQKNEFVKELLELLNKELKINVKLEKAA